MTRRKPAPEPWTPFELAAHLAQLCGVQFRVGPVEPDLKHAEGAKFWVLLSTEGDPVVRMAIVRVSRTLTISVDMAARDDASRKVVTVFRESLQIATGKLSPQRR